MIHNCKRVGILARWELLRRGWKAVGALLLGCALAGCTIGDLGRSATATASLTSTATNLPATALPSPTQGATATPSPTASPSATPTVTASFTSTATATASPTRFALVRAQRRVNVREGPGTNHAVLGSMAPGDGVQVIGVNEAGDWYHVALGDGRRGWISGGLLRLVNPPEDGAELREAASATATRDGGGPIGASTAADEARAIATAFGSAELLIEGPIVDLESIQQTATALAPESTGESVSRPVTVTAGATEVIAEATRGAVSAQRGVDVFAFCNDASDRISAPSNLAAGSTIDIFWAWFASDDVYLRQHIDNASQELRVNGALIANVEQYRSEARTAQDGSRVLYWYVPYGPLEAGNYRITHRVTWGAAISDGYRNFGPGTGTEIEEGSCDFVVR